MRTKIFISLLLIMLSVVFVLNSSTRETPLTPLPGGADSFMIGAYNTGWDKNFNYISDTLGFNLWHIYDEGKEWGGRHYPAGWIHIGAPADTLFADGSAYTGEVRTIIGNVNDHNMKALMMRPKIDWLCFGQRSDYQCESPEKVLQTNPDYWFYSFNDVTAGTDFYDNTVYGSSQWVRYCQRNANQTDGGANWVVKRLKANAEQCKRGGDFHGDREGDWLIKPRIRIDSAFANNPAYWTTPVCSIKVIAQDGQTVLKNVILNGRNFLDNNNSYNGRYLEEFRMFLGDDTLKIDTNWGEWWSFSARGNRTLQQEQESFNHADIQVYWYGNCNMWIDYVRVDNDVADRLLGSPPDPEFENWLQWEAQDIACHLQGAASYRFYIELFEFNNIPCMSYVSRKLDSIAYASCGKHITLMSVPIPFTYSQHVPWANRLTVQNPDHIKRNFVERMGISEILLGIYPFNSSYKYPEVYPYNTWSKIPNTLPKYRGTGTLANPVSPDVYDAWLQSYLDSMPYSFESGFSGEKREPVQEDPGSFRYTVQLGDALSKITPAG